MKKLSITAVLILAMVVFGPAYAGEKAPDAGFAKFLPDNTMIYSSFRGGGDVVGKIGSSNWFKTLTSLESLAEAFKQLPPDSRPKNVEAMIKSNPMISASLDGLAELMSHEIAYASSTDDADNFMTLFNVAIQLAFIAEANFARPGQQNPKLAAAVARVGELAALIEGWRMPGCVMAFKVKKREPVFLLTTLLHQSLMSDPMLKSMTQEYKLNETKMMKLGIALGMFQPGRQFKELSSSLPAIGQSGKEEGIIKSLETKTVELHWGFVSDYFVITLGADGEMMKKIADAATGKAGRVLTDVPEFKAIMAKVRPTTVEIDYFNNMPLKNGYIKHIRPGLMAMTTHSVAEMYAKKMEIDLNEIASYVDDNIMGTFFGLKYIAHVMHFEDGVQSEVIMDTDAALLKKVNTIIPESVVINFKKLVPRSALGFGASAMMDLPSVWGGIKEQMQRQMKLQFDTQRKMNPRDAGKIDMVEKIMSEVMVIIEKHWLHAFEGDSGIMLDEFGKIRKFEEYYNFPIPQGAFCIGCKDRGQARAGAEKLFNLISSKAKQLAKMDVPLASITTYSGKKIWCYKNLIEGDFAPNAFFIDNYVVLSSSLKLSKKIIDLAAGKGKDVTTTAAYGEVKFIFTPKSTSQSFFNCEKTNSEMAHFLEYVLDIVEETTFQGSVKKKEFEQYKLGRRLFRDGVLLMKVFKAWGMNTHKAGSKVAVHGYLKMKDLVSPK